MSNIQSKLKIKFVNNDLKTNKQNKSNTYKIAFKNQNVFEKEVELINDSNTNVEFKINDMVIHNEEQIIGKVNFIGSDKLSVIWNDGTRERFSKNEINQLSIYTNIDVNINNENQVIKENADNIKTRKINTDKKESISQLSEIDKLYNQAFNDMEDEYDDIIDANPNKLKDQMMKRKTDMIEKKIETKQINNIKEQDVNELISLMKDKNMIDSSIEKSKKEEILNMTDKEFDKLKQDVISGKINMVEPQLSEAEKMLQRIKFGGPVIGDFNDSKISTSMNLNETRSLSGGNQRNIETTASKIEQPNGLNLDGFKDLQGLTKPLQVVSEQKSARESIADAISSLDWTTMTKIY